jgi:hypothetical protein
MRRFEVEAKSEVPRLLERLTGLRVVARPTPAHKSPDDPDLVLKLDDRVVAIEIKAAARSAPVAYAARKVRDWAARQGDDAIPLVVVPYMGEQVAHVCREAGASYLDLSGNAHIETAGIRVHIEGKRNRYASRGRPSSAFAPRSERLTRVLLSNPGSWMFQKDLVRETGLGPGYVSRIVRRLGSDTLLERDARGAVRPRDPRMLLEAWRTEYDFSKHHILQLHLAARDGMDLTGTVARELAKAKLDCAMTGLPAAWLYEPFAEFRLVAVYVRDLPESAWLQKIGAREERRGANLWIVVPRDPGVFYGAESVRRIRCASPLQAYLDLKGMPERAQEAAEALRKSRLKWSLRAGQAD